MVPQNSILIDQVNDLYKKLPIANLSTVVISPFLAWILWLVSDQVSIILWFLYIIAIAGLRAVLAFIYERADVNDKSVQKWLDIYLAGVLLSGIGWGSTLILLVPPGKPEYLLTTAFLLGGMVTGSAGSLASVKYGFLVFSLPAILPGAYYLIYTGGKFEFITGWALLVFLIFIYVIAQSIHKTIILSFKKQIEIAGFLNQAEDVIKGLAEENSSLQNQLETSRGEIKRLTSSIKNIEPLSPGSQGGVNPNLRDGKFRVLLEKLHGGIWDYNHRNGEIFYSDRWLDMLGYNKEDANNHIDFWKSLIHPDDKLVTLNSFDAYLDGTTPDFSSSYRLKTKSGNWKWVLSRAQGVVWGNFGEILNVVGIEIDIDDSNAIQFDTLNVMNFDMNEWFYSKDEFMERLNYTALTSSLDNIEHSLFYINISLQHSSGSEESSLKDVLLHEASRLLHREFRQGDAIVHTLNDDSFVVLTEFCTLENAWTKAVALQNIFSDFTFLYKGIEHPIHKSIGITPITRADRNAEAILSDGKTACEMARSNSNCDIYIYSQQDEDLADNFFEKHLGTQIRQAILNKSFKLEVTPLTALVLDEVTPVNLFAVNASIDIDQNEILPGADIKMVLDKNNLNADIDLCKIILFFDWLGEQPKTELATNPVFSIDCSEKSILDNNFCEKLADILSEHRTTNHMLCLGLPEIVFAHENEKAGRFMDLVKSMGCKCAITNVSTAYLSQKMINSLPLEYLKIDNSLIKSLQNDESSFLTVKYINELSHLADLKSIVENVGNLKLLDTLRTIKVDYAAENHLQTESFNMH